MNKYQKAYMIAKAVLQTADELWEKEVEALTAHDPENDELFDTVTAEANKKYQVREKMAILRKVEDEMVNWANEKVSHSKHYTIIHKQAIAEVMEAYNKGNQKIRDQVIDLAFRLK